MKLMGGCALFVVLVLPVASSTRDVAAPPSVEGLTIRALVYNPESCIQYEGTQTAPISKSETVLVQIKVTTKGNGLLQLFDGQRETLRIQIYDNHQEDDEWTEFEGGMLSYRFVDLNRDGTLDLEVRGTIVYCSAAGILNKKPVRDDYLYDHRSQHWQLRQGLLK